MEEISEGKVIAELLDIDIADLQKVFRHRSLVDPLSKKIIDRVQDESMASETRNSLCRVLYSRLFDWLVKKINGSMSANQ